MTSTTIHYRRSRFSTRLLAHRLYTAGHSWLEGFKAVTDIFSPLPGDFAGFNPAVNDDIRLLTTDPYGKGWLFKVRGQPDRTCLDVHTFGSKS